MQDNFPHLSNKQASQMLEHYPLAQALPGHNSWFPSASRAYGEATFICPSNFILDAFTSHGLGHQAWAYRFNVEDKDNTQRGLGVVHGFDIPAVFGPESCPSARSYFTYNRPVVSVLMNYYISFVRTLDPNVYRYDGAELPEWENWGQKPRRRLRIEVGEDAMETVREDEVSRCEFWEGISGSLQH